MQIRQLGEAEDDTDSISETGSASASDSITTSASASGASTASGKEKEKDKGRRFGSARLLRWKGSSSKKKDDIKGELRVVILVSTRH